MSLISLEATDGTRVHLTVEEVCEMKVVQLVLEDAKDQCIPLPNITGAVLLKIETFVKTQSVDVTDTLIDMLKAANYLDYERLLLYLLPKWVNSPDLFPGPAELKHLVPYALYFYTGEHWRDLKCDKTLIELYRHCFRLFDKEEWNIVQATHNNHLWIVKHLLDTQVYEESLIGYILIRACTGGYLNIVDFLLRDDRVNFDSDDYSCAITEAAGCGHLLVVKRLLQCHTVNPCTEEYCALANAASMGNLEIVQCLMEDARVYLAKNNHVHAIERAMGWEHDDVVRFLIEHPRITVPKDFLRRKKKAKFTVSW